MQDWFIIFMYNLFTNIDNAIMIQLSLHKYNLEVKLNYIFLCSSACFVFYILLCVQSMSDVPYINVATALIMFFFAIRMVMPKKMMRRHFTYLCHLQQCCSLRFNHEY